MSVALDYNNQKDEAVYYDRRKKAILNSELSSAI